MATIALYAGKMNQMSSLIGEVKKSVDDYSSELFSLKSKTLNIRKSVCDLDDVIGMIQASTEIQEKKIESLENFSQKIEEFTAEAVRIDEEVSVIVNQNKEDFYNKYNYLKPDAEKNFLEMCFDSAAEWCKEHWKEIVATVGIIIGAALAIAAVVATGGAALIPLLTALGVAAGTAANISLAVAVIAVVSTIGAAALNIVDVWGKIDNPTFNTLQSTLNWTSTISNGLYDIGLLYNTIKYKFGGRFNHGSKGASGAKKPSEIAKSWQGSGKYPGIDKYKDITLKQGKIVYRGEPNGTEYFTTKSAIERSGRNATKIFEGLQVEKNPIHGYRGTMQGYKVVKDVNAALGITKANPQFGKGGLPQVFVPNVEELIKQGILVPVDSITLIK